MVHWCLGDLRRGLAPFWGGEDDSRRRLGQPSAARLVWTAKLPSASAEAAESEWSELTVA